MENMGRRALFLTLLSVLALHLLVPSGVGSNEKINILITGHFGQLRAAQFYLDNEPLVEYITVPSRDTGIVSREDAKKFIRLYFPRSYQDLRQYDFLYLTATEYNLFSSTQDKWMHDAIEGGAGGLNDGSVFSIVSQIHGAWANSQTQKAFPNDAPAVAEKAGGESATNTFKVVIDPDFPDPVLTPFIPFDVEKQYTAASRLVIPRETARTMAWQIGNFPGKGRVPFLIAWDYGSGRTLTCGGFVPGPLIQYSKSPTSHRYGPDMLVNIFLYSTKRDLIEDVEVFHRLKAYFIEYRNRIAVLYSVKDFVDKFGANTQRIRDEIWEIEDFYEQAIEQYMEQDFPKCEEVMASALDRFPQAKRVATEVKNQALIWVYIVEWLVSVSTLFISGFILWSLMVRRRLYRTVKATKMAES